MFTRQGSSVSLLASACSPSFDWPKRTTRSPACVTCACGRNLESWRILAMAVFEQNIENNIFAEARRQQPSPLDTTSSERSITAQSTHKYRCLIPREYPKPSCQPFCYHASTRGIACYATSKNKECTILSTINLINSRSCSRIDNRY